MKEEKELPPVPAFKAELTPEEQQALVIRLQGKWLQHMEWLLDNGLISSTDLATLARLLAQNGWTLDPTRLPKGLKDKLTTHVAFDEDSSEPRMKVVR